jgi:phosphoglycolate phosphatase
MLTIVFDLDGTLIDTAPDLVATLNVILAQERLPTLSFTAGRNLIGGGVRRLIERALAADGRRCSPSDLDRLYAAFISHYAAHIADGSRPFPQLEATLEALTSAGYRLAVCTNKLEWLSLRLLQTFKLAQHFATICGPDTFGVQKPDPQIFRDTVLRAGGEPERAIMVGDSATDVATARAAAVPMVAVDFGYSDVPVSSLQPDRIISAFADLPRAVIDLTGAEPQASAPNANPAEER